MSVFIHPTSEVSREARIADGVWIGPFCLVGPDVEIGEGTRLEGYARILEHVTLGKKCRIFENVVLGGEPQDFAFKGERSFVRIGDGVVLRERDGPQGKWEDTVTSVTTAPDDGRPHAGHNSSIGKSASRRTASASRVLQRACSVLGMSAPPFTRVGSSDIGPGEWEGRLPSPRRRPPRYHGLNVVAPGGGTSQIPSQARLPKIFLFHPTGASRPEQDIPPARASRLIRSSGASRLDRYHADSFSSWMWTGL